MSDGLPTPRRYWSVTAIWLGLTVAVLDSTMTNVALPTIARELSAAPASTIWVVNAYQLAVIIALLPLASLGEIVGYRRVYLGGLIVFALASLSAALAQSLEALIFARVAQGLGSAGVLSMNGALVRHTYPHSLLGRGVGRNAVVVALGSAAGPTVASTILAAGSWQWLFAVNVPVVCIALAVAWRALPVTATADRGFDFVSAALNALTFGLLITGLEGLTQGHSASVAVFQVAAGVAAGWALVRRSLSQPTPLAPVDLLRIPIFTLSLCTSICAFMANMAAFVSLPFIFQYALGRSAVETGFLMTPWPLALACVGLFAGRLADHYPAAILGGAGLFTLAAGLLLLATMPADPAVVDIAWRMAICGAGFGLFQAPNNRTIMSAAPLERSGGAGGMLATARLIGHTCGATIVALIFRVHMDGPTSRVPLYTAAAFAGLAALASLSRLRAPPPMADAKRDADRADRVPPEV